MSCVGKSIVSKQRSFWGPQRLKCFPPQNTHKILKNKVNLHLIKASQLFTAFMINNCVCVIAKQ